MEASSKPQATIAPTIHSTGIARIPRIKAARPHRLGQNLLTLGEGRAGL